MPVGEGHDPPGQLQICLAAPSQRTRPQTRHCEERSDVAIRSPAMRSIAPAVRPVIPQGLYGAPGGARKPCGLQGNGLPHQRARGFAMTGLGVRFVWMGCVAFRKRAAGASPRPTVRVSAMHPAQRTRLRSCTRRAGARPRRAPANLPGTLAPTDQAPKPVIARSAATWQSAPRNAAALHRPRGRSWHST